MTPQQIETLFYQTLNLSKALQNKLTNVSEDKLYNWRTKRTIPTMGDMLDVLYQLNKIKVNEPTTK